MESYKAGIPTGKKCEKCGQGELLERISRHGFFLGCSRYPDCDFIEDLSPELPAETEGEAKIDYCDNCGKEMVIKRGRFGAFLACTGYPDCKTTRRLVEGTRKARAARRAAGRKVPRVRLATAEEARPLRRIHRLHGVSQVQVHPLEDAGHQVPEVRHGRTDRAHGPQRASASSTAATSIRSAISPRRTSPSPSRARSAARLSSWRKRSKSGVVRACMNEGCDWEMAVHEEARRCRSKPAPEPSRRL